MSTLLAGCTGFLGNDTRELEDRIQKLKSEIDQLEADLAAERASIEQLERDLAAKRRDNEDLRAELQTLEEELEAYKRQLDTWNIWGFSEAELERLQQLTSTWLDSIVAIDVITDDGRWNVGTGWVFDETIIATNAHVASPYRLPGDGAVKRYDVWTHAVSRHTGQLVGYTYVKTPCSRQRRILPSFGSQIRSVRAES